MTDLDMVKKCAERMGINVHLIAKPEFHYADCPYYEIPELSDSQNEKYDPLHDDAQAMALVKKFNLECFRPGRRSGFEMVDDYWLVGYDNGAQVIDATNADLNRAIVECVSKL